MMQRAEARRIEHAIRTDRQVAEAWVVRFQEGDPDALALLVRGFDPLVRFFVQKYSRIAGRDRDDCIQEGRLGVIRGCEKFIAGKSWPSSYLALWIRHMILRFLIDRGQCVRIPNRHYSKTKGHDRARVTLSRPRTKLFSEMPDQSDASMALAFEDVLVDEADLADEHAASAEVQAALPTLMKWFLARNEAVHEDVLRRRFSEEPETLLEIGDSYELSRERIRQIEAAALARCEAMARVAGFDPQRSGSFDEWVSRAIDRLGLIDREVAA